MYSFIHRLAGRTGRQEIQSSSARPSSPKAQSTSATTAGGGAAAAAQAAAALSKRPLEPGFAFDGLDPVGFLVRY